MAASGRDTALVRPLRRDSAVTLLVNLPSRRKEFFGNLRVAVGSPARRLQMELNPDRISPRCLVASVFFHACLLALALLFHGDRTGTPVIVQDKLPEATLIYYSAQSLPEVHDTGGSAGGSRGAAGGRAGFHPKQTIHVVQDVPATSTVVDVPNIAFPRVPVNTANLLALLASHASLPVLYAPVQLVRQKSKIAKPDKLGESQPPNDQPRIPMRPKKMADLAPLLANTALHSAVVLAPRPRPAMPKEMATETSNNQTLELQMVPLKPIPVVEEAAANNVPNQSATTRHELVVSDQPGNVVAIPAEATPGSLALSPTGTTLPEIGSDAHGTSVAHGADPGSGPSGDASGAKNTTSGTGTNSSAHTGVSRAPGPSGAGAGDSSAIPGVDIRGGVVTLDSFGPRVVPGHTLPPRKAAPITIVATSRSGGGLAAYGAFKNRIVYTVYLDTMAGQAVLQFAARDSTIGSSAGLTPPDPLVTDTPRGSDPGVVFACVLDATGHLRDLRVVSSASPSQALEDAVRKWIFHPVLNGSEPVDVDALIGIGIGVQ